MSGTAPGPERRRRPSDVDPAFIEAHTRFVTLRDGTPVLIRPGVPGDRDELRRGFERLSSESRYRRFLSPVAELSDEQLTYLTEIDYDDHFAWGAFDLSDDDIRGIGVARYVRLDHDPEAAEAAIAVSDDYQGRGLGTILLDALVDAARARGIRRFVNYVLADNEVMRSIFRRYGARETLEEPGVVTVVFDLPPPDRATHETGIADALRELATGEHVLPWLRRPSHSER